MMNKICVSKVGAAHLREGKPLQDSAKVLLKKGYAVFSVADGHGGERYFRSDVGSRLAVEIAEKQFVSLLRKIATLRGKQETINWDSTISNVERNIVADWKNEVKKHFAQNPFTNKEKDLCVALKIPLEHFEATSDHEETSVAAAPKERTTEKSIEKLYGTTLISCLYIPELQLTETKKFSLWIAVQIGDGMCLIQKDGDEVISPIKADENLAHDYNLHRYQVICPIKANENLGFGVTTSLCSKNAINEFRHAWGFDRLNFICACSDGVQDSFTPDDLKHFANDVYDNIQHYGAEREQQELEDFFPRLSEQGSGDDVSFAGIFITEEEKSAE